MTTKYIKISEQDIIDIILRTAQNWQSCGIISPSNIAYLLKTSRYQVNKYIKILKIKNIIIYKSILFNDTDYCYPPYHGYCLSEYGKKLYSKELKELEEKECELIQKCFN